MASLAFLHLRTRPAERRLLQEGRLAGPMPWVIGIMMFLTVLATAAGLALGASARAMAEDLAGRLTIQVSEANPVQREAAKQRITFELERLAFVSSVRDVPQAELAALLAPWLGADGLDADVPMPALIDVELRRATPAALADVRAVVSEAEPQARVTEHLAWLQPLADLVSSLRWLAAGLVLLMIVATAATVVLAARSALNTHKATIEVMHLLGSTDAQVATLFQRRIALDSLFGGLGGMLLALVALLLIGLRLSAVGSELLSSSMFGWSDWAIIAALPFAGAALATVSARLTVIRALRRSL